MEFLVIGDKDDGEAYTYYRNGQSRTGIWMDNSGWNCVLHDENGIKTGFSRTRNRTFLVMKETSFLRDGKGIKTDCRSGLETRQLWECCN